MCNEIMTDIQIMEDKHIKLSEYLQTTYPSYNGCFSEYNENDMQLHPDTKTQKKKGNITDVVLSVEFDTDISIVNIFLQKIKKLKWLNTFRSFTLRDYQYQYELNKDNQLNMIATIKKNNGNIEQYYIIQNIKNIKFISCKFNNDFIIRNNLTSLKFNNCIFEKRCYINNQYEKNTMQIHINNIEIKKTIFNENFKLHNTLIDYFYMVDTDFIKNADFYKSKFTNGFENKILFNAINFHELALFGEAIFKKFLQFKYVTFKGYTHFRSTTFENGLDLEYANIEKEMNFFNIKELDKLKSIKSTSQETYRIVKYQLQKVGNIIEANRYHALELNQRKNNAWKSKSILDWSVLFTNNITSEYSTNWLLVLIWIINIGMATTCLLGKDIYQYNNIMQYISILNKFDAFKVDSQISYVILMFNKVSLGYLYYQLVTAIRKDTKK